MDYASIAAALQNQWNQLSIRGFMILSLCVQVLLAIFAPYRQWTSNRYVIFTVWSAYILSDWAATFAFGLISNAGCRNLENNEAQVPPDVLAFWAAFLLVHLGGPDNITAFSMEDNALWMRHLVGLVAQIFVFMYIFVKTLPNNRLLVPTILVFVTGVINYGERSRALYLASLDNLKKTIKKDTGEEQSDGVHIYHTILKGLVVDIVPDHRECVKSREYIIDLDRCPTLDRISSELNLLYELLYTKIKASNSTWGKIVRAIASYSTMVAFILFCIGHKNQFHRWDLVITFALFAGVYILHLANMMTLITSSFSDYSLKDISLFVLEQGIFPPLLVIGLVLICDLTPLGSVYGRIFYGREWSKKMAYFNILSNSFKQRTLKKAGKPGKKYTHFVFRCSRCSNFSCSGLPIDASTMIAGFIWNKLAGESHVSWEDIDESLFSSVSFPFWKNTEETMDVARLRELYEARGDRALKQLGCDQLIPYIEHFQFEHTLLIWHIATEICYNLRAGEDYVYYEFMEEVRRFSKKLSDYMMYLLVRRPKLMSAVAGINHIRYRDTCEEVKLLARKKLGVPTMQGFCELILWERANIIEPEIKENNHPFSVLKESCELVELLRRGNNNMWGVIYKVWVELLSYAAGHCRADSHARVLSEGSELITAVWVLMSLCGIGDHFPVIPPSPGLPDGNTACSNSPAGADAPNANRASPHALRMRRREEYAEQVAAADDKNIAEGPNAGQAAVGALSVPQWVEDDDQVAAVGDDHIAEVNPNYNSVRDAVFVETV